MDRHQPRSQGLFPGLGKGPGNEIGQAPGEMIRDWTGNMLNWVIIVKNALYFEHLSQTFFMQVKKIIVKPVAGIKISSRKMKSAKGNQHV